MERSGCKKSLFFLFKTIKLLTLGVNNNKMKIDKNYEIIQDPNNFILRYENEGDINEKTGKPMKTVREHYYMTLEQALIGYTNKVQDTSGEVSDLLAAIKETQELIKTLCGKEAKQ